MAAVTLHRPRATSIQISCRGASHVAHHISCIILHVLGSDRSHGLCYAHRTLPSFRLPAPKTTPICPDRASQEPYLSVPNFCTPKPPFLLPISHISANPPSPLDMAGWTGPFTALASRIVRPSVVCSFLLASLIEYQSVHPVLCTVRREMELDASTTCISPKILLGSFPHFRRQLYSPPSTLTPFSSLFFRIFVFAIRFYVSRSVYQHRHRDRRQ